MIAVFNILIYVIFAFVMSFMAKQSLIGVGDGRFSVKSLDPWLWCYILFFTFIAGTRWFVGSDFISYSYHFHDGLEGVKNGEVFWEYLANGIHDNGYYWVIGFCVCAFIQIFFLTEALKPYRYLLIFFPFVLFGGRLWADINGAVRQMMVACALLWASRFIVKRQYIYYLIFVYLASLLHHSALYLIVLVTIPGKLSLVKFRYILMGIVVACCIAGQTPSFQGLVEPLSSIIESTEYSEEYGDKMKNTLEMGESVEDLSFGPMMFSYLAITLCVLFAGPAIKRKLGDVIREFDFWYNMTFLYATLYFLFCNLGHLFIRPIIYLLVFQVVTATVLFYYLWEYRNENSNMKFAFLSFCVFIAMNTIWDVKKSSGLPFEAVTYKSIFTNTEEIKSWGL